MKVALAACLLAGGFVSRGFSAGSLENDLYKLSVAENGSVTVEVQGMPKQVLLPRFTLLWSESDPLLNRYASHPNYPLAPRTALRWSNTNQSAAAINASLSLFNLEAATGLKATVTDDKQGGRAWEYRDAGGKVALRVTGERARETTYPFAVGRSVVLQASQGTITENRIEWKFPELAEGAFSGELILPPGKEDPQIRYTFRPHVAAYFSVAFLGAPGMKLNETLAFSQECDGHNHKQFNFVMSEPDLHLPRAQVATNGGNLALVADPKECRFRLPKIEDSRFGAMLEARDGILRPILLAPLLGGAESHLEPGESWTFLFRYIQRPGNWKDTYAYIARGVLGLRDQRDNTGPGALDHTLERVADFLADRNGHNYALWDAEQKYYDYFSDKTGIFKPFSPLYGLSLAIVTDDEALFRTRALPAVEYSLSRSYNVFAPYENSDNKQASSARRVVGAPYLGYAQLLSLYDLLQRRTPALLELAEKRGIEPHSISDQLAHWKLTGDPAALEEARAEASRSRRHTEEEFFDLLDLAEVTGKPEDLQTAIDAAYDTVARSINLYPVPPDRSVTVDPAGKAPIHRHSYGRHRAWGYPQPQPIEQPQQTVPAWRIARLGVPGTGYPMEYWMNTQGAILRTAALAQDDFLRDVTHWGMVGRFGNYPGDNRSEESLVAENPVAMEAPPWRWSFATVNPGHAWDFAGALLDFLVSDGFEHSKGAIAFPALSAAGSAFRVRIYGSGPGQFYGDAGVYLWLPRGLVTTDNPQCDWLTGYGNGYLYLALWNQSFKEERVTVVIDPALAECESDHEARVWRDNAPVPGLKVTGNRLTAALPAKGIVAWAIPARVKPRLQARVYDSATPALGPESFRTVESPFGPVHALLLRAGQGLTSAFVYTEALPEKVIAARLRWKQGNGDWQEVYDGIYPYEFSLPLEDQGSFSCVMEIEDAEQKVLRAPLITLSPAGSPSHPIALPPEEAFPPLPAVTKAPSANPPPSSDFVEYLKKAANPDGFGFRAGRYYPYSTPLGRRIAWRQPVWDKHLYAQGCTPQEAENHLLDDLASSQSELRERLAQRKPAVDFSRLDLRQQETLLDLGLTEGASRLSPDLVEAVLNEDWKQMIREHLYVRYAGHAPDHLRNKAFAQRWDIK